MPKLSQKSFVSGQYDRIAQNQESINGGGIVASGLSYAKNVLSSDRGELRKRLGTKFLKQLDGATVLIPFRMNDGDDVILAADSNEIRGFEYSGDELITLMSVRPSADMNFPAANTWSNGTAASGSVSNGDWTLSFSFPRPDEGRWVVTHYYPGVLINGGSDGRGFPVADAKKSAPQYISISNLSNSTCMRSIKLWFWTIESTGYQYKYWSNPVIQYSDDGVNWVGVQTDYKVGQYTPVSYSPPQDINTQQGIIHIDAAYTSKCALVVEQTKYAEKHNYWRVYFQTGKVDISVKVDSASFVDPGLTTEFIQTSPYAEEQLKNIKYSQDKNIMFISCEDVIPHRLINNTGELTLGGFTPANTPTIWSTMGGYPAAVSMFQNRVWFGGFQNNPATAIASKFGDYETFNSSSPVQKDDYLNLRCNQLKAKIRNLVGGQNVMCCFSEDGISYIDGGSTGLLATNENIEFKLKNRMPASGSTPGFKDDVMLYSSSDGTKLYGVDFDLLVNRFQVSDLAKYAKDITKAKITELHYVNNESKLVYGLMEDGSMFALLYEKGQYQGFFPLDFGGIVYDICPIKVGRNYKLLMVVFRDGNWYLEEKLDAGNYIDTSTPRLTDEEKKWATYDNLENNIALDCYQSYDESFDCSVAIIDDTHILSNVDLSNYVGKSLMFANDNEKDFVVGKIQNNSWAHYDNALPSLPVQLDVFYALGYNGSVYVAISEYGYVSTSSDGINWSSAENVGLGAFAWQSVVWDGTKFVLLGASGYVSTSNDGITWTNPVQNVNLGANGWRDLVYTGSKFVAVSYNGNVSSSTDGINWSSASQLINVHPGSLSAFISYDGSRFLVLDNYGYTFESTDGTTWSDVGRIADDNNFVKLVYDGSKFITISSAGNLFESDDGVVWSNIINNLYTSVAADIIYANNKLIIMFVNRTISMSSSPYNRITIETEAKRGTQTVFLKAYPEFTEFMPNLPQVADVAVISEGRYFNATKPDENGKIYLPAPCHKVIYGVPYESVAIIKLQAPYESLKNIAQVDLSVINSTHLEVGTNYEDTQNIEKIDDSSYYDLTRITMNDTYRLVLSDTPETTKNLILRSNKGVPFTVIAVDMYVNYSNLGGD
ncbi:MAG: hypothetical protein II843_01360 [Alphaproteobacteria bacterium]|nr:hypothetical protein [Alphaproteobacteria bacterium]